MSDSSRLPPVYYNEIDSYCVEWLLNLMYDGLLPDGVVDDRPIQEVDPDDLRPYTQCHFFAGLGGWAYALRLAGWPPGLPVWTGSCPCQPFSVAGRRKGTDDPRHLWPYWLPLISRRRPQPVFGEQVASEAGQVWLTRVRSDLGSAGYKTGYANICAAGVGAPHIRQRLYWVAYLGQQGLQDTQQRSQPEAEEPGKQAGPTTTQPCNGFTPWDGYGRVGPDKEGHFRRIGPHVCLLDNGLPCRVAKVRAFGNSIVPPLAAEFVRAYMDVWFGYGREVY